MIFGEIGMDRPFKYIGYKGEEFRKRWEEEFVSKLSIEEKNKMYIEQFLWHAVSYGYIKNYERTEAISKYKEELKGECYVFFQEYNKVFMIEEISQIPNSYFNQFYDVYIVDKGFNKCYIHTHEKSCGPYFVIKNDLYLKIKSIER